MYLLSDFFIATRGEIFAREVSRSPVLTLPTVLGRGVDGAKILYLEAIVGGPFDRKETKRSIEELVRMDPPHYPFDVELRPDVTEGLAALCDLHVQECAEVWASIEGWDEHGVTSQQVLRLFAGITGLARQTLGTRRGMYVWQCDGRPKDPLEELSHF